jgi:geranylgeranylglycerol-phosphate geranylgeranyltransferase
MSVESAKREAPVTDGEAAALARPADLGGGMARAALIETVALGRLVRINAGVTATAAAVIAAWMTRAGVPPDKIALIGAVVFALTSGGNAFNDISDRMIDGINQPGRPIPTGAVSVRKAAIVAALFLGAGVLLSLPLSGWCIALTLVDAALLVAYALYSKTLGVLKNVIVGYLVATAFLIGAFRLDNVDFVIATLSACAFLATVAREIVKDVEDMDGDRRHGARTLPIVAGPRAAFGIAYSCLALAVAWALAIYRMGGVNDAYLALILMAGAGFAAAWVMRYRATRLSQQTIMAASILVLAAFGLGRL